MQDVRFYISGALGSLKLRLHRWKSGSAVIEGYWEEEYVYISFSKGRSVYSGLYTLHLYESPLMEPERERR
jgi:hypothetical protein